LTWWEWALLAGAGAAGAVLRYLVDTIVTERLGRDFPLGTLVVNVSGSFVLGVITGLVLYHGLGRAPTFVLGTGLVGAYTTFSTFGLETVQLAEGGRPRAAGLNVAASVVFGAAAAALGLAITAL
jgi:CrcB protein